MTIYVDELITEISIDEQVKLSVGGTKKLDLNAGDVNGDGDITSADAVLLLKYLAGYNVVLGR